MEDQKKPQRPYDDLLPETILSAIESLGYICDGRFLALNSYENRVYQVGIEDAPPVVTKFYRPRRWSKEAILEEHEFALELAERELPVVAPIKDDAGKTLHQYEGYWFAVYPRRGGHWPELEHREHRQWMGRFIGQIHAVGATKKFRHRPEISIERLGYDSVSFLKENQFIPAHLEEAYSTLTDDLLIQIEGQFGMVGPCTKIRIHGDCHPGNILWTEQGPHFVDFDDTCTGPAVQDLWMMVSGDREEISAQFSDILEGYTIFRDFDVIELQLVEALRTLRMLYYSAWLARRWDDPAFPRSFPWFNTNRYWEEQVLLLREQAAQMQEPTIAIW